MDDGGRPARTWRMAQWSLWRLPWASIAYVLAVELAALLVSGAVLASASEPSAVQWVAFAMVVGCAAAHLLATRRIERVRSLAPSGPQVDLTSIWVVGAVCSLPPALALCVVLVTRALRWSMSSRPPHRNLFAAATITLSACSASGVLQLAGHGFGPWTGLLQSVDSLTVLVVAGVAYWACQLVLVAGVFALTTRRPTVVGLLGDWDLNVLDAATVCLGLLIALVLSEQPLLLLFAVPVALVLHRAILVGQFERAASRDAKTGLANATYWRDVAHKQLDGARRNAGGMGLLIVDLDHFKNLNDRYGHLAGDEVLRAVADALRGEVPDSDFVGRFGGEEFIVLVPGVHTQGSLLMAGDRVRRCIERLTVAVTCQEGGVAVATVTGSVGAALYPFDALTLDGLLQVADRALYAAKRAGRNRTCLASWGRETPVIRPAG
ncbi:GGDEF domain-containing protein [Kutzneria viridogrisea]|uniref:GGDEF domain-containing protein n=2 Tax=Kutzneria TaxID=43356 RepID=W5WQ56_9PSEU|nr:GGDEF domain-containing protein [Kutzneria albida]AHI00315.1 hypothetical protein KALB_6956 [Kutzneria albida DSM 43870]